MKGYGILVLLAVGVLSVLPPLFFDAPSAEGQAEPPQTTAVQAFTVVHSDDTATQSEMDARELTRYETMASIAPDAPEEAIKAQTVVCYTALCYQHGGEGKAAPITSTALPFPQAYTEEYWRERWGTSYEANVARFEAALDAVYGQCILYEGAPIMAVYHAMNSGQTEAATVLWEQDVSYLRPVASAADALQVDQLSTVTFSEEEVRPILEGLTSPEAVAASQTWFSQAQRTAAGTVTKLLVCGEEKTGQQVMAAFSLPSAAFEVQVQDSTVIFTVHGRGHFVGLSVCGSVAMAKDGATYEAIIKHYYTGVVLRK